MDDDDDDDDDDERMNRGRDTSDEEGMDRGGDAGGMDDEEEDIGRMEGEYGDSEDG